MHFSARACCNDKRNNAENKGKGRHQDKSTTRAACTTASQRFAPCSSACLANSTIRTASWLFYLHVVPPALFYRIQAREIDHSHYISRPGRIIVFSHSSRRPSKSKAQLRGMMKYRKRKTQRQRRRVHRALLTDDKNRFLSSVVLATAGNWMQRL